MQVISTGDLAAIGFVIGIPAFLLTLVLFQHLFGYLLSKKYDAHFFKPPYFTQGEIEVYRTWPLSLIRYATYILFTAFPWTVKRRFKGHASPYSPGSIMQWSCKLWVLALVLGVIAGPTLFVLMVTSVN